MQVQNISQLENLSAHHVGHVDQTSLQASVRGVSSAESSVLKAVPQSSTGVPLLDVHQLMRGVFAKQRAHLARLPSSSNTQRLEALDALESRQFQPAFGAQLKVRLTGKGLGGVLIEELTELTEEQQNIVKDQQLRVNDLLERFSIFAQTEASQSVLLQQYTELGDAQAVIAVSGMLTTTRKSLRDVHNKLSFAQKELARVQAGNKPHLLASTHGFEYYTGATI